MTSKNKIINYFDLGIDIVLKKKIKNIASNKVARILTVKEFKVFENLGTKKQKIEYLSGRWAAKEAIYKSLPDNLKLSINKIEILNYESGKPYCTNFKDIRLSISHSEKYVICSSVFIVYS